MLLAALGSSPARGAVSTGQDWELQRGVSGAVGDTLIGGTDRLHQALGEGAAAKMSGGTDVLLGGFLSGFPLADYLVEDLISLGTFSAAGTALVLATNNPVQVRFTVDIDPASLPGTVQVMAVLDPMANPTSVPWTTNLAYDALGKAAVVSPTAGNWSPGTLYEVYVAAGVSDLEGNQTPTVATFTFTTIRDPLVDNVAIVRSEPAVRVAIPANAFGAPFVMVLSSGTDTSAVREANAKALTLGSERKPIKIVTVDSRDQTGAEWGTPLAQNIPLTLAYADADADGMVDGMALKAKRLGVWRLDEGQRLWVKQWDSSVDQGATRVTYPTNHFSTFALFSSLDTEVNDVFAFPVPFRPNAGDAARYGSWAEGIKFVNLPSVGAIHIYTLSGQRVRTLDITAAQMSWDARNSEGQAVASGLYIWEVRSGENRKTGKLVIVK